MKVLDPQAALLTTTEVHRFLASNPPRQQTKKIGSYKPVNLKNYQTVREDFLHYVTTTVPYIETFPPPEAFVKAVVPKLRAIGLTKTEALMLINLGAGLPKNRPSQPPAEGVGEEGAEGAQETQESDDRQLLAVVIEELTDRFPDEDGEDTVGRILEIMQTEFDQAQASTNGNGTNGLDAA
ncbi:hypothetical protein HRR83_003894 [Exophiala dermatitidis]|nr:hypothetical protein HRR75_002492 [Exophiala dermatitidis]KAJ4522142.1 hypothetical protein HRR74_002722 [Exophiala dermatitidis]KAJ4529468.1 hypothetical protein HRR73_000491 [Exophiala dermatitidis]KAJ4543875.1 hypothetical protein HRR76_001936 [Exophiala dermatitidis]KAJ4557532.1 hypothetical protein HRR78_001204 [Exophiala dermatitidis]